MEKYIPLGQKIVQSPKTGVQSPIKKQTKISPKSPSNKQSPLSKKNQVQKADSQKGGLNAIDSKPQNYMNQTISSYNSIQQPLQKASIQKYPQSNQHSIPKKNQIQQKNQIKTTDKIIQNLQRQQQFSKGPQLVKKNQIGFQDNVSKKIQGLKDLSIETYDQVQGRPSLVDIENQRVFEGNIHPQFNDYQQYQQILTPQLGQSNIQNQQQSSDQNSKSLHSVQSQLSTKFLRKSQMNENNLNQILESRARISINVKTGKHEYIYSDEALVGIRQSNLSGDPSNLGKVSYSAAGDGYLLNSESLFNFLNDQSGPLDNIEPIRPSKLVWQLPYEERKSFINQQCEYQLTRLSQIKNSALVSSSVLNQPNGSELNLKLKKQDSDQFQKASGSDSEFENIDDYVDESEEFGGANRSVKLSIRALNFNIMLADKQCEQFPNQMIRVSLLSRASSLAISQSRLSKTDQQQSKQQSLVQKNYDRSSKLLNLLLQPQNSSNRDSNFLMQGIDECEEYEEYSQVESASNNPPSRQESKNTSSRPSTIRNQYNFQTFYTPSQTSKKMSLDNGLKQNQTFENKLNTEKSQKTIKFFTTQNNREAITSKMENQNRISPNKKEKQINSTISEKELEDSQAVDEENTSTGKKTGSDQELIIGRFSQKQSIIQQSFQEEPQDPELENEDFDNFKNDSQDCQQQIDIQENIQIGRSSKPSKYLKMEENEDIKEVQFMNDFIFKNGFKHIEENKSEIENNFQMTQQLQDINFAAIENQKNEKQALSQANSRSFFNKKLSTITQDEQTEERFIADTGNSQPDSVNNGDKQNQYLKKSFQQETDSVDEHSFNNNYSQEPPSVKICLQNNQQDSNNIIKIINSNHDQISYHQQTDQIFQNVCNESQNQDKIEKQRSLSLDDEYISERTDIMEETSKNDSEQRNDLSNKMLIVNQRTNESFENLKQIDQTIEEYNQTNTKQKDLNSSQSPYYGSIGVSNTKAFPIAERLRTTERNPLTMSETTTIDRDNLQDHPPILYENQSDQNPNQYSNEFDPYQQQTYSKQGNQQNSLNQFVTKVPQIDTSKQEDGSTSQQTLHQQHFVQTVQALQFISNNIRIVEEHEMRDLCVQLPPSRYPHSQKKLAIFDMDETLIHCVDDIETQDPDIVLEIDFPDEEMVYAGINIRPYIMECLEEANKHFQVIVFTASHQVYADAILDYIDPNHEFITHRLYRQHCFLTDEGYYVKDLRIFGDRDLKDIVIVDNSVYSFAFQIDNGIPIIPFYNDKTDEEMLHLVYYLNCLAKADDVREQNRQAFELFKLSNGENLQTNGIVSSGDSASVNKINFQGKDIDADQFFQDQYENEAQEMEYEQYQTNLESQRRSDYDQKNEGEGNYDEDDEMNEQELLRENQLNERIMLQNNKVQRHPQQISHKDIIEEESKEDFNSYDNRDNLQILSEDEAEQKKTQDENEDYNIINEVMDFNDNYNSGFFHLEQNGNQENNGMEFQQVENKIIEENNEVEINNGRQSQQLKINVGSFLTTDMQVNEENSVQLQDDEFDSQDNHDQFNNIKVENTFNNYGNLDDIDPYTQQQYLLRDSQILDSQQSSRDENNNGEFYQHYDFQKGNDSEQFSIEEQKESYNQSVRSYYR